MQIVRPQGKKGFVLSLDDFEIDVVVMALCQFAEEGTLNYEKINADRRAFAVAIAKAIEKLKENVRSKISNKFILPVNEDELELIETAILQFAASTKWAKMIDINEGVIDVDLRLYATIMLFEGRERNKNT